MDTLKRLVLGTTMITLAACGGADRAALPPEVSWAPPNGSPSELAGVVASASPRAPSDSACADLCRWQALCTASDAASCLSRCASLAPSVRDGLLDSAAGCAAQQQCGDDCFASARADVEGEHASASMVRCLAARTRCSDEGVVIAGQRCTVLASLREPYATLARGCLEEPCARLDSCLAAAGALTL